MGEGRRPGKKGRSGTLVLDEPAGFGPRARRASRARGPSYLVLLHPPGTEIGRRTTLEKQRYVVGRDSDCDVPLDRDSVSRQHAELCRESDGSWMVVDRGSTNGTFVNERRVTTLSLKDGDQVRFGDVVFKFLSGGNVESLYHEEIYQMTVLDGLTAVHNRRYFLEQLERELASAHRHENPLTLVMLDIDHFKQINDQRGHLCGDAVLKELAQRIRRRIRREDLFARYGGEEFAAILSITGLEGGLKFAESLRHLVADRPFEFDGQSISVTISLGVTTMLREAEVDAAEMIRRADERLYQAKRAGRNRVAPDHAESAAHEDGAAGDGVPRLVDSE